MEVGSRVVVDKVYKGVIKYIGKVGTSRREKLGIELETPSGLNNGSYSGKRYFICKPRHGVFRDRSEVKLYHEKDYNQTGLLHSEAPIIEEVISSSDRGIKEFLDENVNLQRMLEALRKENNTLKAELEKEKKKTESLQSEIYILKEKESLTSMVDTSSTTVSSQKELRSPKAIIIDLFNEIKQKIEIENRIFNTT